MQVQILIIFGDSGAGTMYSPITLGGFCQDDGGGGGFIHEGALFHELPWFVVIISPPLLPEDVVLAVVALPDLPPLVCKRRCPPFHPQSILPPPDGFLYASFFPRGLMLLALPDGFLFFLFGPRLAGVGAGT